MKTQEEILVRLKEIKDDDSLGFKFGVLTQFLTPTQLAPLVEDIPRTKLYQPAILEEKSILATMENYMDFAWEKALCHRGISAIRSVEKFQAWLWVLGNARDLLKFAEDETNYPQYGAPILKRICNAYGFPIPDNSQVARMAVGLPCTRPSCQEGCE